jgi:hypothetical protein
MGGDLCRKEGQPYKQYDSEGGEGMIEVTILNYLLLALPVDVALEKPDPAPKSYVLFEKTGSSEFNHTYSSTFAFQSYAPSLCEAAALNDFVKDAVRDMVELDEIVSVSLNTDYNFTDPTTKQYRYQAVFDIKHY